jgi:hypothetical protein
MPRGVYTFGKLHLLSTSPRSFAVLQLIVELRVALGLERVLGSVHVATEHRTTLEVLGLRQINLKFGHGRFAWIFLDMVKLITRAAHSKAAQKNSCPIRWTRSFPSVLPPLPQLVHLVMGVPLSSLSGLSNTSKSSTSSRPSRVPSQLEHNNQGALIRWQCYQARGVKMHNYSQHSSFFKLRKSYPEDTPVISIQTARYPGSAALLPPRQCYQAPGIKIHTTPVEI